MLNARHIITGNARAMNDNDKPESPRLGKLQKQQEKIKKQITLEKQRLDSQARKNDTRRKILTGAILIEEAENNPDLKRTIDTLLHSKLTRNNDRVLFNLPPLPEDTGKNKDEKTG